MFGDDCEPLVLSPLSLQAEELENDADHTEIPTPTAWSVQYKKPSQHLARPLLARTVPNTTDNLNEDLLITPHGTVKVVKAGNPSGPALLTFHDLGLNSVANFQVAKSYIEFIFILILFKAFFTCPAMSMVISKFCIYHITAPGQHADDPPSPTYPSMEQLSEVVEYVCHNYGIPTCIGMGVGLGANVLVRLAARRPKLVDGLILINCDSQKAGWVEWGYHKVNMKNLKKCKTLDDSVVEYLIWYHLGSLSRDRGLDVVSLASIYKQYFKTEVQPASLLQLIQSYANRSDLGLVREIAPNGKIILGSKPTLKMPVLNMVGENSPHVDATVTFNGRLDPAKCTWMKIRDAAMVLEEQPNTAAEAITLFIQGLGYVIKKAHAQSTSSFFNEFAQEQKAKTP